MADSDPPNQGTSAADSSDSLFVAAVSVLTGDKLKRTVEQYIAAQVIAQERALLQQTLAVKQAIVQTFPSLGPPIDALLANAASPLTPAIQKSRLVKNAPNDTDSTPKTTGADPVQLASGQLVYTHTDLAIEAAGIRFEFIRTYRSRARYPNGPLGTCWDHSYNVWLREIDANTIAMGTGQAREDRYHRVSPGGLDSDYFAPDAGSAAVITLNALTQRFELRMPGAMTYEFSDLGQLDADYSGLHRLEWIYDRFQQHDAVTGEPIPPGNYLRFYYDADETHLLTSIEVNHPSRLVTLEYDEFYRISTMTDYSGRQVSYTFDDYDDLIAVTLPASNDRRLGRSTFYEYSSENGPLPHLLLNVLDPDGRRYLEVEYGASDGFVDQERVVRQRDNEGEWLLQYFDLVEQNDPTQPSDPDLATSYTLVTQPNGHQVEYWFNDSGGVLFKADEFSGLGEIGQRAVWRYQYNPDGNQIAELSPLGVFTQKYFFRDQYMLANGANIADDVSQVPSPTASKRLCFGNLIAVIKRHAAPFPLLTWPSAQIANGIRAIDPQDIVQIFGYDLDTQLPTLQSDPRKSGDLDSVPAVTLKTFQYSVDARRVPLSVTYPPTTRPDQTARPPAVTSFNCDPNGRIIDLTDPEGHATHMEFFADADVLGPEPNYSESVIVQPNAVSLVGYPKAVTAGQGETNEATTSFLVNRRGLRTQVTDARGVSTKTQVDSTDCPVAVTRQLGPGVSYVTSNQYTGLGKLSSSSTPIDDNQGAAILNGGVALGSTVHSYLYNDVEQITRERIGGADPSTRLLTRTVYNGDGLLVRTYTPRGCVSHTAYDRRRLPVSATSGYGAPEAVTVTYFYDLDGRKVAAIDGRGSVTRNDYDGFGRLIRVIQVADIAVGVADARPLASRLGHTRVLTYDKLSNVIEERHFEWEPGDTYSLLAHSQFQYDERGQKVKDMQFLFDGPVPAGAAGLDAFAGVPPVGATPIETWYFLDGNRRIVEQRAGVVTAGASATPGSCTRNSYDYAGRNLVSRVVLLDEGDSEVTRTETTYDGSGNAVRIDRYDFEYDATNALIKTEVISVASDFDLLNRLVATTDGLGNRTTFRYDSRDLLIEKVDPLGNVSTYDYDLYGRKTRVTERPAPGSIILANYSFDDDGQIAEVARGDETNSAIVSNRYSYDAVHHKISEELAHGTALAKKTVWKYDAAGSVAGQVFASGLATTTEYDILGNVAQVTADVSQLVTPPNPMVLGALVEQFSHDGLGRMISAATDAGPTSVAVRYDSLGRPVNEVQSLAAEPDLLISREFDTLGATSSITYPSGKAVIFSSDLAGRLRQIVDAKRGNQNAGKPGVGARNVLTTSYIGRRRRRNTLLNGLRTYFAYDAFGRQVFADHQDGIGASILGLVSLYGAGGDVGQDWQSGPQNLAAARRYSYDGVHRLMSAAPSVGAAPDVSAFSPPSAPILPLGGQAALDAAFTAPNAAIDNFVYDAGGNRLAETISGVNTPVDQLDRLTPEQYDDCGNPLSSVAGALQFDFHNRIVKCSGGAVDYSALYDALGRRVAVTNNGVNTRFAYDGNSDIAAYVNGALTAESVLESTPDGRIHLSANGEEYSLHRDRMVSIRMVTASTGVVVGRFDFDPYGTLLAGGVDLKILRHRFMGREWDENLNLYYFRARYYDPATGRFLQRDPVSTSGIQSSYQAFKSNPLLFGDLDGRTANSHEGDRSLWGRFSDAFGRGLDALGITGAYGFAGLQNEIPVARKIKDSPELTAEVLGIAGYDRQKGPYYGGLGSSVGLHIDNVGGANASEVIRYHRTGKWEAERLFLAEVSVKGLLNPNAAHANGTLKTDYGAGVFVNRDDPRSYGIFGFFSPGIGVVGGGLTLHLSEDPLAVVKSAFEPHGIVVRQLADGEQPTQTLMSPNATDLISGPVHRFIERRALGDIDLINAEFEKAGIDLRVRAGWKE